MPSSVQAAGRCSYLADWAMSSGSGKRDNRIHTSCAVVVALSLDRALAKWCVTVECDSPRLWAAARADPAARHPRVRPGDPQRRSSKSRWYRGAMQLVERGELLADLDTWLAEAKRGSGSIVLLGGEAGVGKTSVVRAFVDQQPPTWRVLWGILDPHDDRLLHPTLTDHLFLSISSQPIGDSTPEDWITEQMAAWEECTATEPIAVDGATGLIGSEGCDLAVVTTDGRGYWISFRASKDDPSAVAPYDRAWFEEVLATVQLHPKDAVD